MPLRTNGKKPSKNSSDILVSEQWNIKQFRQKYKDPHLLIIDLRSSGIFRGGPPVNSKEIPREYHQGHLFLALNLNLTQAQTPEDIQQEIMTGANSAGGSFLDTLVLAISSGFHFLFYNQDGEGVEILEMLKRVSISYHDDDYSFPEDRLHWLNGMFINYIAAYSTYSLTLPCRWLPSNPKERNE